MVQCPIGSFVDRCCERHWEGDCKAFCVIRVSIWPLLSDTLEPHIDARAKIIIGDKDAEGGKETAQEIVADGGYVFFVFNFQTKDSIREGTDKLFL